MPIIIFYVKVNSIQCSRNIQEYSRIIKKEWCFILWMTGGGINENDTDR